MYLGLALKRRYFDYLVTTKLRHKSESPNRYQQASHFIYKDLHKVYQHI